MREIYSTSKLAHHPEVLEKLRTATHQPPVMVQFFPTNVCNHSCSFCSYGHWDPTDPNPAPKEWKNHQLFDERTSLPREKMLETIADLDAMGCKAIEISGGGEPTTYKYFDELLEAIAQTKMDLGLVSNGVLLSPARIITLKSIPFLWARISIDAGSPEDYKKIRHTPDSHWDKAWEAVSRLAAAKRANSEQAVGVGFVADQANWRGLYDACRYAKDAGADNIRLSAAFTPQGLGRFGEEVFAELPAQINAAIRDFQDDSFQINELIRERWANVELGQQEYPFCYWKDVGCVIGADSNVYACCSWAYNDHGLMGSIRDQSFREAWEGDIRAWQLKHDPRRDCKIHCLYQRRNEGALRLMIDREGAQAASTAVPPAHANFL